MLSNLKNWHFKHPLRFILLVGLILRLVAAFFSIGYAFSDDHFLVIEEAQKWVDHAYTDWLPYFGGTHPSGPSLIYPGLHFLFFEGLKLMGINDPEHKMLLVRLIHGIYSLIIIFYGFKIAKLLSNQKTAILVGWALSVFFIFPFLSVRNLVEFVCIPPIMVGFYLGLKYWNVRNASKWMFIGFISAISISLRYQMLFCLGGMGLAMILEQKWKQLIYFCVGVGINILIFIVSIDVVIWGYPFAEINQYFNYNLTQYSNYPNGAWYQYLLLFAGIFIFPLFFILLSGYIKVFKKYLWLTLPILFFFTLHSVFPNKQERFILPILPIFLTVGIVGWNRIVENKSILGKIKLLLNKQWIWIWLVSVNSILCIFLTPASTKISKVRVMDYLRHRGNVEYFALETTQMWGSVLMPRFYHGNWNYYLEITQEHPADYVYKVLKSQHRPLPTLVVFAEPKDLTQRVKTLETSFHRKLVFEKEIESSYLDKLMTFLNPVNVNQTYYIYRFE